MPSIMATSLHWRTHSARTNIHKQLKKNFLTCHNFKLHIMTRENTEDIQTHKGEGFLKKINTKESGTLMSYSFT